MIATAFVLGFFTALGWWSANKLTDQIDRSLEQPKLEQKEEKNVGP